MKTRMSKEEVLAAEKIVDLAEMTHEACQEWVWFIRDLQTAMREEPQLGFTLDAQLKFSQQAAILRWLASQLMQIGRAHGAKYWNAGISEHDWLDQVTRNTGLPTGESPTL